MHKQLFFYLLLATFTASTYAQEPVTVVKVDGKIEFNPNLMGETINSICNAHFEKPLGKIVVFLAAAIAASYGAYLAGSSLSYAIFPPKQPAEAKDPNYNKKCLLRGLCGALLGAGLTWASILAIIKSDTFLSA